MGIGKLLFGLVVTVVGFAVTAPKKAPPKSDPPPPPDSSTQGYRVVDCSDVVIDDPAVAHAWARGVAKGRTVTELVQLLGGGCPVSAALLKQLSADKALFVWELARHGLAGYVDGGGSTTIAALALGGLRSQAAAAGVDVSQWSGELL